MTQIHDSTTCTAGVNGQPCVICHFAREFEKSSSKSPSDAPGTENQPAGFLVPGDKNVSERDYAQSSPIPVPTTTPDFTREWETAPRWATRTTERESAEWWLLRGRQLEREALLAAQNQDLQEILRVARERITR